MVNDFKQTVNLKEKSSKRMPNRTAQLNRVYSDRVNEEKDENILHRIDKPVAKNVNEGFVKRIIFLLAIIILSLVVYFMFLKKDDQIIVSNWYSVKLVNNEIFYGRIIDTSADPVVINDTYYNYDQQLNDTEKKTGDSVNLRLVKRGKETHGPEGTMNIVRSQILYMEPLKDDSKVLEAILSYEK